MWNGAVFIPLIEEIDTIDPGVPLRFQFRGDGLAHEERGLQVRVNRSRQSLRVTRVDGIQVAGAGAARHVDQAVQVAVGAPRLLHRGGHAVLGGDVGGDGNDRQSAFDQRRRCGRRGCPCIG